MKKQINTRLNDKTQENLAFITSVLGITDAAAMEMAFAEFVHSLPWRMINAAPRMSWSLLNKKFREATRHKLSDTDISKHRDLIGSLQLSEEETNTAMQTILRDPHVMKQDPEASPPTMASYFPTPEDEAMLQAFYDGDKLRPAERKEAYDTVLQLIRQRIVANFETQKEYLSKIETDTADETQTVLEDVLNALPERARNTPEGLKATAEFLKVSQSTATAYLNTPFLESKCP